MNKIDYKKVEDIQKIAENMLNKKLLSKKDLILLNKKIDIILSEAGVFKRYFKRLS